MSTDTIPTAATTPLVSTRKPRPVRFVRLVQAEARKFVNTRSGLWLLTITLGLSVAIGGGIGIFYRQFVDMADNSWQAAVTFTSIPINLLLPVMAILLITGEWSTRSALTTFTLEPRRLRVIAAKVVVLVGVAVVGWLAVSGAASIAIQAGGAAHHIDVAWQITAATLLGPLAALLVSLAMGFAFGLALMNSPAAIVLYMALPQLFMMTNLLGESVTKITAWLNINANLSPLNAGSLDADSAAKLAVSCLVWVVIPGVIGLILNRRREVS